MAVSRRRNVVVDAFELGVEDLLFDPGQVTDLGELVRKARRPVGRPRLPRAAARETYRKMRQRKLNCDRAVAEVENRHGVARSTVYRWRREDGDWDE